MTSRAPYTLDRHGAVAVCCDGPELLAYSGANDQAIWKQFTQGILVGVVVAGNDVATVDADGHVIWWRKLDGARMRDVRLDVAAAGLAANPADGTLAVMSAQGVVLVTPKGDFNILEREGVAAVTFGQGTLAIAYDNGVIEVIELGSGAELGVIEVHAKPTDMTWSNLGYFVVAAGTALHLISLQDVPPPPPPPGADPKTYKPPPPEKRWGLAQQIAIGPTGYVEASNNGILVLATAGPNDAVVVEMHSFQLAGKLSASREITGLGFGNNNWCGVGLEDMACNRVDLVMGKLTRCQPGLGRSPSTWGLKHELNQPLIRGAIAMAQAQGQAIAERVQADGFLGDLGMDDSSTGTYVAIGCVVLSLLCGGCCCTSTLASMLLSG